MDFDYSKVYRLKGRVKDYAWGGNSFIADLTGIKTEVGKPIAEYWMGAHASAPAYIEINDSKEVEVNRVIAAHEEEALGHYVYGAFHRLPYLFKILDVKEMLSIQVHPNKKDAEYEFNRENNAGIALGDPSRNYKDNNHKPELAYALSEIRLLHGFKPADELAATLEEYPEFTGLLRLFLEHGYRDLYKEVMMMDQEKVNDLLQPILGRILPLYEKDELKKDSEEFWVARAAKTFDQAGRIDRGIFSIFFFNLLSFKPGEAIFQDAGLPHAYLEGQMAEIMANSDNVLRGGLTVKHVDVPELLKHVRFEPTHPTILKPELEPPCEQLFKTSAPDFELHLFDLKTNQRTSFQSSTAEILFTLEGDLHVRAANEIRLGRGNAAIVFANQPVSLQAERDTRLLRATVPVHNR
jgi:mannose-6-phosphate isomerase